MQELSPAVHDRDRHPQHAAGRARLATAPPSSRRRGRRQGQRYGVLVEYGDTEKIFTAPADQRTEDYITGRFG